MKRIIVLLILFVMLPASSYGSFYAGNRLVGNAREYNKFISGLSFNQIQCGNYMGMVLGVYDSTEWMYNKLDAGVESGQLFAIVSKYLKAHPEEWNSSAYLLIQMAFLEAFGMNEKNRHIATDIIEATLKQYKKP